MQWSKVKNQLTASDRSYFLARLGYRAAMRHDSRALDWFREAQNTTQMYPPSDLVLGWQARAALRVGDWDEVLRTINRMSMKEQQVDTWRYWKARALLVKGHTLDANTMLIPLSNEHSFYGQLAREELGTILTIADKTYRVNKRGSCRDGTQSGHTARAGVFAHEFAHRSNARVELDHPQFQRCRIAGGCRSRPPPGFVRSRDQYR
jgi:hypothetical protein